MITKRRNRSRPPFTWDSDIPQWHRGPHNTQAGALFPSVVSGTRGSPVGTAPGEKRGSAGTFRGSWGVTVGERRLAEEHAAKPEEGRGKQAEKGI